MKFKALGRVFVAALAFAVTLGIAPQAKATTVGTQLAMGIDVSGSVDSTEFALQLGGYAAAFNSAAVQSAIEATPGGIAAMLYQWSGNGQQTVSVAWTHLTTAAEAAGFATAISAVTRAYVGLTGIAQAINFGAAQIASNGFDSSRKVIDISGDGTENVNTLAQLNTARDNAVAAGITVNGLAIELVGL
ncbi:MAG: DUF1194 domain-containing protein, partial [Gemmobacter sp.]